MTRLNANLVKKFLLSLLISSVKSNDQTSCMTDFGDGDELYFVCVCINNYQDDVRQHTKIIEDHPGFSLAHFTYNLAGSYFGKSVHIRFQECRHLKLVLDQMELSRIGSEFFRPDIQVRGLVIDQVYHLELVQKPETKEANPYPDEYLIAAPLDSLIIDLASVALVKVDAGATFSSLQTSTDSTRLYIDLNGQSKAPKEDLNVLGFRSSHIYFITNRQKIRLQEGENLHVKMKELALSMSSSGRTHELSLLLVAFAAIIFVGILGLVIVVVHRQKRKRQLKALLRAKNLGPILESREIAQSTGMKHYPQYVHIKKCPSPSRGQTPVNPDFDPMPGEMSGAATTNANGGGEDKKLMRKLDINDLWAAIMIRMRNKNEYQTRPRSPATQETSFYYKESSVSTANNESPKAVQVSKEDVSVQVHKVGSSSGSSSGSDAGNSYVSRISQQVFVSGGDAKNYHNIKSKMASFFSSVSRYKSNTRL